MLLCSCCSNPVADSFLEEVPCTNLIRIRWCCGNNHFHVYLIVSCWTEFRHQILRDMVDSKTDRFTLNDIISAMDQ